MSHYQELSLFQLNHLVREAMDTCFPEHYWVRAELSEVHSSSAGHCYVEFVEKSTHNQQIVAKVRGSIWANRWRVLKPLFEQATQQQFVAGIKVMVQVSITFHELYGYSLVVHDIDPSYTLGDMARNRQEILRQLEQDGVRDLNKELPMPTLPRRVAIISSSTAAGYGDFINQLHHNEWGFHFYTHLFPAVMQGLQTEQSIMAALDKIHNVSDLFDVVVLIRGGGATSDLNSFDSYLLASHCAQFPLPIITGIGHERDDTVLDQIAHTRVKTPTAAAAFLLHRMDEAYGKQLLLQQQLSDLIRQRMDQERTMLQRTTMLLPQFLHTVMTQQQSKLALIQERLQTALTGRIEREQLRLQGYEQVINLTDPQRLLEKGYSLTLRNGEAVGSVRDVNRGDRITTLTADGSFEALVTDITYKK